MHMSDSRPIVDLETMACLSSDGLHLATVIHADGTSWPWVLDLSDRPETDQPDAVWPAHELLGPLPPVYEWRLDQVTNRVQCQAITQAGERCSRVRMGPTMCWQHASLEVAR